MSGALVVAASVFAAAALFGPRAVQPRRLPVLSLDADAAQAAMELDRTRATRVPSSRWARELRALHQRLGSNAHHGQLSAGEARVSHRLAERRARSVRQDHGEEGLWALRAQAVTQLQAALDHELPARARQELLGKFEEQLVRYGVRSDAGELRAPLLVAWAMFKARWNMISGLSPTAGLSPVEVQAYEGWLTLHAESAPANKRFEAAHRFEAAGGRHGAEAVAVWALRLGHVPAARDALERAIEAGRSVRLRNYTLALNAGAR